MSQTIEESVPSRGSNMYNFYIRMMRRSQKKDGEVEGDPEQGPSWEKKGGCFQKENVSNAVKCGSLAK